jgi:glyoxylase-like metal-dependent hydrolase (beta-lactamase superfamily II)
MDYPGFKFPYCNCLLIEDDINCLIDTSAGKSDLSYLMKKEINLIINSHGHLDHYINNYYFPDSKVIMHPADHGIAQSADNYLDEFGLKAFAKDPQMQQLYLDAIQYRTTRIDDLIMDKQVINLGSTSIETVHLPGHSAGHCGFFFPEQGFIFSADIDFSVFGPWYANWGSSLADFFQSIDRLIAMKPDYIITGHGDAIVKENISRRLLEYRDIIYARQQRIIELLRNGRHTVDEIARECPVYIHLPEPKELFYVYEEVMVAVHLRYLQESGDVIQEDQRYYLK